MADDSIDRIPRDMLFVACTRPTMLWGVPAEGFVINFFACYLAFLWIAHANILSSQGRRLPSHRPGRALCHEDADLARS